ncbi:diiron oxygenase [Streptomyces sp. UNOC14_S4]|uniref:AurF N-oxygenase family protein n=1 Tax=Streptomyces sp. UNOC14_S4 TaxID=2872340 RepID=UPI001E3CF4A4|nr:diiron oxygenase [Streptomyces sp. UNOC14_S4]MCC3766355.1 diiron oxygenase [Streptomyces sp. UNOC14_S4]
MTPTAQHPGRVAERLLRASAEHAWDVDTAVDWHTPLLEDTWYAPPEVLSLYGTDLWERMDHGQRIALSRSEAVGLMSAGMWTELILMQLLARYVAGRDFADSRSRYALTEIGEETRHSLMFSRAIERLDGGGQGTGVPWSRALGAVAPAVCRGPGAFAVILAVEEVHDHWQREAMRDERVQPFIRQICRLHVADEARHVGFARSELLRAVDGLSAPRRELHRETAGIAAALAFTRHFTDPRIYRAVGLDPKEAQRQARRSPRYRRNMLRAGEKAVAFLTEAGMIGPRQRHWWRRAGLMP